jgi:hypothetical protein
MVVTKSTIPTNLFRRRPAVTATTGTMSVCNPRGFFRSGTRPAQSPNPSTGTYLRISIGRWYNTVARASTQYYYDKWDVRRVGKRPRFPVGKQYVVFHDVLSRHKLGISFLKFFQWFVIIFIIVVIGAGGTIIIVSVRGLVMIGRGIENVGSRVILLLSSSAAAAGSNRLEWTTMKIQRHVVGYFLTFKNLWLFWHFVSASVVVLVPIIPSCFTTCCPSVPRSTQQQQQQQQQQQVRQHSTLYSRPAASCSPLILFSTFLGEDGRQII